MSEDYFINKAEAIIEYRRSIVNKEETMWYGLFSFVQLYVPGAIRTPDRRLRRALLYPAELLGHNVMLSWSG
jgi:hypothetical protein